MSSLEQQSSRASNISSLLYTLLFEAAECERKGVPWNKLLCERIQAALKFVAEGGDFP